MRFLKLRHLTLVSYFFACFIIIYSIGKFYLINTNIEQRFFAETDSKSIFIFTAIRRVSNLNIDYKTYRRQLHRLYSHNNKWKKLKYNEIFLDANGYNFEDLTVEEQYTDTVFTNDIIGGFLGSVLDRAHAGEINATTTIIFLSTFMNDINPTAMKEIIASIDLEKIQILCLNGAKIEVKEELNGVVQCQMDNFATNLETVKAIWRIVMLKKYAKQKSVHSGKEANFKGFAEEYGRMKKEYEVVHHETNGDLEISTQNSFSSLLTLNTVVLNQIEPDWMKKSEFQSQIEIKNNHKVEQHMDSFDRLSAFTQILPSAIRDAAAKKKGRKGKT